MRLLAGAENVAKQTFAVAKKAWQSNRVRERATRAACLMHPISVFTRLSGKGDFSRSWPSAQHLNTQLKKQFARCDFADFRQGADQETLADK